MIDISDIGWLKLLIYILLAFIGTIVSIFYILLLIWPTPRTYRLLQKINGPPGQFIFGNAVEISKLPAEDILVWFEKKFETCGSRMRLWVAGSYHVYLRDPSDIQVVLKSSQHITKGLEYIALIPWLEEGLLTSSGSKWQQRRKLLTPAFHFKILDDNISTLNKNAKILSEKFALTQGTEVPIEKFIPFCTLDVIGETALGLHLDSQRDNTQKYVLEIKQITELIIRRITSFWMFNEWLYYFTKCARAFKQTRNSLHNFSYKIIREKKMKFKRKSSVEDTEKGGKKRYAFLDLLLEIDAQNPGVLSDKDIREEVDTFMFEGHDTTSAALTFILFNLAANPDIQESPKYTFRVKQASRIWDSNRYNISVVILWFQQKAYEEQLEIFGNSDREATMSDLSKMTYLEKVIKESLRMYPSVPHMSRLLDQDVTLDDGTIIPNGTNVVIHTFLLHYNEEYWPDPHKFDPERFSDEEVQGRHPFAYIPFSAGPRNCIGQKFAMMELKIVTSTIIRKLRILPVTKRDEFKVTVLIILRPTQPILLKFEAR